MIIENINVTIAKRLKKKLYFLIYFHLSNSLQVIQVTTHLTFNITLFKIFHISVHWAPVVGAGGALGVVGI